MLDLTYTTTITPPERKMEEFLGKIRKLRERVRDEGGTTKLVKKGKSLELTISAQPYVIIASVDVLQQLCVSMWRLEAGMSSIFEKANKREDDRKRDFFEMVMDQVNKDKN